MSLERKIILRNRPVKDIKEADEKTLKDLAESCREASLDFTGRVEAGDTIALVKDFLKSKPDVSMVLLNPHLSADSKLLNIRKMLKSITKPIVALRAAKARA